VGTKLNHFKTQQLKTQPYCKHQEFYLRRDSANTLKSKWDRYISEDSAKIQVKLT
jgi:hypothetical protein